MQKIEPGTIELRSPHGVCLGFFTRKNKGSNQAAPSTMPIEGVDCPVLEDAFGLFVVKQERVSLFAVLDTQVWSNNTCRGKVISVHLTPTTAKAADRQFKKEQLAYVHHGKKIHTAIVELSVEKVPGELVQDSEIRKMLSAS